MSRRDIFWSCAALLAAFALGIVAGVGLAPALAPEVTRLPPGLESLDLSEQQRHEIEQIVSRHAPEVERALGDARPRLRRVQDKVAIEIERTLDEDQRRAFRRLRRERRVHVPP